MRALGVEGLKFRGSSSGFFSALEALGVQGVLGGLVGFKGF